MNSASDTTVKASTVVADGDVHIQTGGNFTEESVEETSESTYVKQVKKSGLLSGGGLGFTIGKEKKKDQYTNKNTEQVGSTIGSVNGNVSINSNKETSVQASEVIAKKDISITAENVNVASKDNISNHQEKHEYKRTGITVSLGGQVVQSATGIVNNIKRGAEVQDKRLAALYGYEAGKQIKEDGKAIKDAISGKGGIGITVGFSSSSSKSESKSMQTEAASSRVNAGENVNLTSAKDITIHGSDVSGKNVNLKAGENLNISSAEQTSTNTTKQSGKGGSIGVTFGGGLPVTVSGSVYSNKENENGSAVTHKISTVSADQTLTVKSQKDTNIVGSKAEGDKVVASVGGNLNIESQQDKNDYNSKSSSMGASFSTNLSNKTTGGRVEASKGKINSNYQSVTEQAGIYAGNEGFDIHVNKNTDLKGAVIDSNATAEKNKLTTGTLTWKDIQNKADYKSSGAGIAYAGKDAKLNEKGLTPNIDPTLKGHKNSKTKSGVAEGEIITTNTKGQKQNISELNRDTKSGLNKLQEIFDKKKVQEKKEFLSLLAKDVNEEIHKISNKNKWKDGSKEKIILHTIASGILAEMSGSGFHSGALAGGVNEYVIGYLTKTKGRDWIQNHPDEVQWMSTVLGGAINKAIGADVAAGAGSALAGTKWNEEGEFYNLEEKVQQILAILPSDVKEKLEEKAKEVALGRGVGYSLTSLGNYTIENYPQLKKDVEPLLSGIKFVRNYNGIIGAIMLAEAYYEYKYNHRPITLEEMEAWVELHRFE